MTKFNENDVVVIRLSCRDRAGVLTTLDTQVRVGDLGMNVPKASPPVFDVETFRALLAQNVKKSTDKAIAMQADFAKRTAEYVANNGGTPVDNLAAGIVEWVIRTRPGEKTFTSNPQEDGFVITTNEIAIAGPYGDVPGERIYRVTAVGTWGS